MSDIFQWKLPAAPGQVGAKPQQPALPKDQIPFGFRGAPRIGVPPFSPYIPTWQNPALRDRSHREWGTNDWVLQGLMNYQGDSPGGMHVPTEGDFPALMQSMVTGIGRYAAPGAAMPMIIAGQKYQAGNAAYMKGYKMQADLNRQQTIAGMEMAQFNLNNLLRKYGDAYAAYTEGDKVVEPQALQERLRQVASDAHDQFMLNLLAQGDMPAIDRLLKHLDGQSQDVGKAIKVMQLKALQEKEADRQAGEKLDAIGRNPLQVPKPTATGGTHPSTDANPTAGNLPQPDRPGDSDDPTLPPITPNAGMSTLEKDSEGGPLPADDTSTPLAAPAQTPITPPSGIPDRDQTSQNPLAAATADTSQQGQQAAPRGASFADRFGAVNPARTPPAAAAPAPTQAPAAATAPPAGTQQPVAQRPSPPIQFDPLKLPRVGDQVYDRPKGGQWGPVDPPPPIPDRNGPGDIGLSKEQIQQYATIMNDTGQLPPELRGGAGATSKLIHTQAQVVSAYAAQQDHYLNEVLRHVVPGEDQTLTMQRLNAIDPDLATKVRSILHGHLPLPVTGYGANSRLWARVSNFVFGVNPKFNNQTYTLAQRTRASFNTGGYLAKQNGGMVRAYEHGALIAQLAYAVHSSNNRLYNSAINQVKLIFGDPNIVSLQDAFNHYAQELTNTFRGGVGNEADIMRELRTIGPNATAQQILAYLGTTARLMHAQGDVFAMLWNRGTHMDEPDLKAPDEYLPGGRRTTKGAQAEDFLAIGDGQENALKAMRYLMSIPVPAPRMLSPQELLQGTPGGVDEQGRPIQGRAPVTLDAPGTSPDAVRAENWVLMNRDSNNPETQRQVAGVRAQLRKLGVEGF